MPNVLSIASDEELPLLPVTQRLALLQVAMFHLLPELIELLDNVFQTPASDSMQEPAGENMQVRHHSFILEEHMRCMRTHVKSSGLGLMWLGVLRTHCTAPDAQAVALHEIAARAIKLHLRRCMRSTKVLHHKESDGTDVAQTPKEDCILVQHALNSILLNWQTFCRDSLILHMAAKYPGCLHADELAHPKVMFSLINPMLCMERAAKLLGFSFDVQAFQRLSRDFPTSHDIFPTNFHVEAHSSADSVAHAMKSAAAAFSANSFSAEQQLSAFTDDIVVSSPILLKSHCPATVCRAVGLLLETRMLALSAAGLMAQSPNDSLPLGPNHRYGEFQPARSVCDDAFVCAFQPEHLSASANLQTLKLPPIMQIFSFHATPTMRKRAVALFKNLSASLLSFNIELLNNNSSCVLLMIECLLSLSDVANGSSKCFFLRSALDWMESLWKSQEITSIRTVRSLRYRSSNTSQSGLWKKLRSAQLSQPKNDVATSNTANSTPANNASPAVVEQTPKKYVTNSKVAAAELSKEKERIEQNMKDHDRVYKRVHDKLYHASVFVSYMCSCTPTAIISKHKGRWSNLIAGFELAYRKFMSLVSEGMFKSSEVKRVLWHTLMLLQPLASEYRAMQSCRNPSALLLLEAFSVFSKFAVTLDGIASSHFDGDFVSDYEPIFHSQMRQIIFVLSLSQRHLECIFPNCSSVSEAVFLISEGSYYQILHGEKQTLAQEMKDTVENLEGPSVAKALALFAKGKKYTDPQQRRNEEAMAIVLSHLTQYSVSDDFLSVELFGDSEQRQDNSVAVLIICLMVHNSMHLHDVALSVSSVKRTQKVQETGSVNLKHTLMARDTMHCLCTLLQGRGIVSVNCCNATIVGSIPPSFAELLTRVAHLDLEAVKFQNVEDDFIMRKILSSAVSATHVNLMYTYGVADEELYALASASGTNLTNLQIGHNNSITDSGLCFLATRCPSLQHLHILGCDNVAGQFVDFVSAYCPVLATLDVNFSNIQPKFASLLPQLTANQYLRSKMADIDLILKLGAIPSLEEIDRYLSHHHVADNVQSKLARDSKNISFDNRSSLNSATAQVKFASSIPSIEPSQIQSKSVNVMSSSTFTDNEEVVKVSVAEANSVFGKLERVNEKALLCIEQWISLLYGPSESNRAWLGRAEFAMDMMTKYDAATDDYLVINEDDPEFEIQFNEMLHDFTRRGLDSEQCVQEVKKVLLKKRIEEKENVMAERRLVAEMERDRRTLSTKSECVLLQTRT